MLKIDKKLGKETIGLIRTFLQKDYSAENIDFELNKALFILGYKIRMRIRVIFEIALAENSMNELFIKNGYDKYREYLNGDTETLKSLIQKYNKLEAVNEFR